MKRNARITCVSSKKGAYEVFMGIFFLVVLLTAVFLWFFLAGGIQQVRGAVSEQRLSSATAYDTYQTIVACNGKTILSEERISECLGPWDLSAGATIKQEVFDSCEEKYWITQGLDITDTRKSQFSYWVPLEQQESKDVCLARLVIYI